jgi:hypothetical protein
MINTLLRSVSAFIVLLFCFAGPVFAVDYEEEVSGPDANSTVSSEQYIDNSTSNGPGPSQGSADNINSNPSKPKSTKKVLRESANRALGAIIETVGENISNSIRGSANQGNPRQDNQSYSGSINDQPAQDNTRMRRKKKITDY